MALTTEQAAELTNHRRNVAYNESMLATATANHDAAGVAKFTDGLARERAHVARLEALAGPAAPPPPVVSVDTLAAILVRLTKSDTALAAILVRIGKLESGPVLAGVKGAPGDKGPVGDRGPAGEKGPAGVGGSGAVPQQTPASTAALSLGLGRMREGLLVRADALAHPVGSEPAREAEAQALVLFAQAIEQLEIIGVDPGQVRSALSVMGVVQ